MKLPLVLFVAGLCLTACETDASGHKHYTGPSLHLDLGFNGATVGLGIASQPTSTVGDK